MGAAQEQVRVNLDLNISAEAQNVRFPMLRRNVGVRSYSELLASFLRFDGAPVYDAELWSWDLRHMAYCHMPLVGPRDRVPILLSWDVSAGWVFRPDTGDVVWWAPLFPKDDQRNRPDQALIAMALLVEKYAKDADTLSKTVQLFREHTRSRA